MGDLDDHKVRDAIMESMEEAMMEEIQTLRVGLEDWKRVAQEWATENLVTTKKLVEAEVEVATLRAEVERLRGIVEVRLVGALEAATTGKKAGER